MQQAKRSWTSAGTLSCTLAVAAFLAAGCGMDESGPLAPRAEALDPTDLALQHSPQPSQPQRKPETIAAIDVAEDVSVAVLVRAKDGGVVSAGRHRLTIPSGALKTDTMIQLKDVTGSAGFVSCEAYPEGLEFSKPVLLESSFRDLKDPFGFTIYWIANPGKSDENWVDMRAGLSADTQGLAVRLSHFSTYAPGKAGWAPRRGGQGHFRPEN
ncbi:MAG: hypothetical protein SGI90_09090 [Candidatus Eisenbacteria bacterium]|nr:hypothetical protein [Candidatus Eisenbacteria bacterium]